MFKYIISITLASFLFIMSLFMVKVQAMDGLPYGVEGCEHFYADHYGMQVTANVPSGTDIIVVVVPENMYMVHEKGGIVSGAVFTEGFPPEVTDEWESPLEIFGVHIIVVPPGSDYVTLTYMYSGSCPGGAFVDWFIDNFTLADSGIAFASWYDDGYDTGYADGHSIGFSLGYTQGLEANTTDAYNQGYNDGLLAELDMGFLQSLLTGMASIFTLQIFGAITLGALVSIPIAFAFFRWFIKMLGGS